MLKNDPFLPGMNHVLCGKPPKSALVQLKEKAEAFKDSSLSELSDLFSDLVPSKHLQAKAEKKNSRTRTYSLNVTFWAFLSQVLSPQGACLEAVRKVQAYCSKNKLPIPSSATASYSGARGRLPVEDLKAIHKEVASKAQGKVLEKQRWLGHDVKVVDGTGITLEDTPENQEAFPQPSTQKEGCGFPVMKVVPCFCLASGTLLKWAETSLKSHESRILKSFLSLFGANDVVLTDRGFTSYTNLSLILARGSNAVMRAHQMRKVDYRKGKRLGRYDQVVTWIKPQRLKGWTKAQWAAFPDAIEIRTVRIFIDVKGFRVRQYDLVTTLLDAEVYTADELARLYFRRWAVELYFRHIKTTMGMERLRCKTPEMVRKELLMFIIAYNLVRALLQQAAHIHGKAADRLSFKAAVDTLRQFRPALLATRGRPKLQQGVVDDMLAVVASETVPLRMHRSEPRAVKRRPKGFQLLTKHRSIFEVSKTRKAKK